MVEVNKETEESLLELNEDGHVMWSETKEYEALKKTAEENGLEIDPFVDIAKQRAAKILKKNSREIKRLTKHAEKCLLELNKDGYVYAIGKVRTIIRKPLTTKELESMYEDSVKRLIEIVSNQLTQTEE